MPLKNRIPAVLFSNPRAGQGTGAPKLRDAIKRLVRRKLPHVPQFDMVDDDQVKRLMSYFRERDVNVCIILGGDGTMHRWMTNVLPTYLKEGRPLPTIARLRCGTQNVGDKELGVEGLDQLKTLEGVLDAISHGVQPDVVHRHVLQVNDSYGFIFGTGLVIDLLDRYYAGRKEGERLGAGKAVRVVGGLFLEELRAPLLGRSQPPMIKPFDAALSVAAGSESRSEISARLTGAVASTLHGFGLGLHPTYRARERFEHFHFVGVKGGFWSLVRNLPEVALGLPMKGDPVDVVANGIRIRYLGARPPITIDGEIYAPERLPPDDVLRIGPRLTFIRS